MKPSMTGRLTAGADELLRGIRASGFPSWSALGIEQGRAAILELKALAGQAEPVAHVDPIPLFKSDPSLTAELYRPESSTALPVMVYLHGGGWVLGNHTGVDAVVRMLVNRSGCAILSMDYRLAPEHKYPAALDDVYEALQWVVAYGDKWGLDANRLAVGGDSSGANLAAAVSLLSRDKGGPPLTFQLLVYPALDHNYENDSYRRFGDGVSSALSRADVVWFHEHYVNRAEELDLPYVSPLRADSFARLPRTLVLCAEIDPLLDEGIEYARRLEQAGVPVELQIYPGMFHCFWRMGAALPESREAIDYAAGRMRQAMASSSSRATE